MTQIKRQTVIDSEERKANLDISIKSGMLFTLKMTGLSVILKPQQHAPPQSAQSITQRISSDILTDGGSVPPWHFILHFSGSLNEFVCFLQPLL